MILNKEFQESVEFIQRELAKIDRRAIKYNVKLKAFDYNANRDRTRRAVIVTLEMRQLERELSNLNKDKIHAKV